LYWFALLLIGGTEGVVFVFLNLEKIDSQVKYVSSTSMFSAVHFQPVLVIIANQFYKNIQGYFE